MGGDTPTPPPGPLHSHPVFSRPFQTRSDTSSHSPYTGYYERRKQNGFGAMLYNCVTFTTSFPVMMTQILKTWRVVSFEILNEHQLTVFYEIFHHIIINLSCFCVINHYSPHNSGKPCLSRLNFKAI